MHTILFAEDDQHMQHLIKEYLELEGYSYSAASNGKEALELFQKNAYDAVILDVMMPIFDGWRVCKTIRETSDVPILMLTARGEEYDRLLGFELGADDYIVKPYSPKELMARLKVALKRAEKPTDSSLLKPYSFKGLWVDINARVVKVDEKNAKLTPKEFDLLVYLIQNNNRALSRQQILDGVWGEDFFGDDRTVDSHIKMLREAIKPYKMFIKTVWGIGYKFDGKEGLE